VRRGRLRRPGAPGALLPAAALLVAALLLPACSDPARDAYGRAEHALLEKRADEALAGFRSLVRAYPDSRHAPQALLRMGDLYAGWYRNDPAALEAYRSLVYTYPGAPEAPKALLAEGKLLLGRLYDPGGSVAALNRLLSDYPSFGGREEALLVLGRACVSLPDPDRGKAALTELLDRYPDSPRRKEARWLLAYVLLSGRRFAEADREFRKLYFLSTEPKEKARARWGMGQAMEGVGDVKGALVQYQAIRGDFEDPAWVAAKIERLRKTAAEEARQEGKGRRGR
jgi:TolA-binding protein